MRALTAHDDRHVATTARRRAGGPPRSRRCDEAGLLAAGSQQVRLDRSAVARRPRPCGVPRRRGRRRARPRAAAASRKPLGQPVAAWQDDRRARPRARPTRWRAGAGRRRGRSGWRCRGRRAARASTPGATRPAPASRRSGGWCQLLRVVDDHEPQRGRERPVEGLVVGRERSAAAPRIHAGSKAPGAEQGGDLVVLAQQSAPATHSGATVEDSQPREVVGVEAELDGSHEQVAQLAAEGPRRQREAARDSGHRGADTLAGGVPGKQLTEDDVLLGAAEQPRRRVAGQGGGLRAARRTRTRGRSAPAARSRCRRRRAVTASRSRAAASRVGREEQALVGRDAPGRPAAATSLDGDGRLARARRPEHPQHAGASPVDDGTAARGRGPAHRSRSSRHVAGSARPDPITRRPTTVSGPARRQ